MRKFIAIMIILLSFSFVYADDLIDTYIDTLENQTFTQEQYDTYLEQDGNEALSLLLRAHLSLMDFDYQSAYPVLEEALTLTEEPRLSGQILYYLAMIDLEFNDTSSAIKRGLQLKEIAHGNNDLKGVVRASRIISIGYFYVYDYDEARLYAKEALDLSKSIDYKLGMWEYYSFEGYLHIVDGNYDLALEAFETAKSFSEENDFSSIFYNIPIENEKRIAYAMYWRNREDRAVDILEPLLDLVPENNPLLKAQIYYAMGQYSFGWSHSQQYYLEALNYYDETLKIDDHGYFENEVYENLAASYYVLGEYHKAADYYHKVMRYHSSAVYYEKNIAQFRDLDTYKYDAVSEKIRLLEELSETKTTQLKTQQRLLLIVVGSLILFFIITILIVFIVRFRNKSKQALYISSITDKLTAVYNRSKIIEVFESKLDGDNAVILLDLDNFKNINDHYGHAAGDEVLKGVADTLQQSIRGEDVLGRYGGGEFLIILEKASQSECRIVAERIRSAIEACEWSYEGLKTTCSVGVTRIYSKNSDEVLNYVDSLMYQAKSNGKNQVVYG